MGVDLRVTNRVLDLVAEGIDLAVRAGKLKDSRLIAKRFSLGYFGLWASSDYLSNTRRLLIRENWANTNALSSPFSKMTDSS
jgi:hypothetical protein